VDILKRVAVASVNHPVTLPSVNVPPLNVPPVNVPPVNLLPLPNSSLPVLRNLLPHYVKAMTNNLACFIFDIYGNYRDISPKFLIHSL
jgi:hypothetical protein